MNSVPIIIGLDYSSTVVQLCAMDESAKILINRGCPNDWRELVKAVEGKGIVKSVAIEACSGAADLAEELVKNANWPVSMAHPHYVAKMKGSPDKTDYTDARLLADLSRVGYLPLTWLPPAYIRELRQLVNYRQQLADQRRAAKLRVGGLLREHRVTIPDAMSRWTKAWVAFIRSTEQLSESARWIIGELLDQLDDLNKRIGKTEARLASATKDDLVVKKLLEQEGIGDVTAWVFRAFIGEFDRFGNGKQLARYCGMSPKNASSGERVADAGLIKASNKILRTTVIQAAHRLIRTSKRWGTFAESMRVRGKPACVIAGAVGNRWIRRMHYLMTKAAAPTGTVAKVPANPAPENSEDKTAASAEPSGAQSNGENHSAKNRMMKKKPGLTKKSSPKETASEKPSAKKRMEAFMNKEPYDLK